jgi:hypothetical protein
MIPSERITPMTMEPREAQQPAKTPYFKGAFFWYVVLQVSFTVAMAGGGFVFFFAAGALYPENVDSIVASANTWESASRLIGFAATLALCIVVSRRHEIGFGRGVGLFFAGNFTSTLICLPLLGLGVYGDEHPSLTWAIGYFSMIVAYGIVCAYLIIRRRRQMLTSRRQRDVVEAFD